MNDGSIRIGTKIDFSGVKKDIKALEKELATIQKEADKVEAKRKAVMDDYKEKRDFDSQFPEEFSHREAIDKEAAEKLDPIIKEREILNEKAREYSALLDQAKAKLQEQQALEMAGKELGQAHKAEDLLANIQSQAEYNSLIDALQSKMADIERLAESIAAKRGVDKEQLLATNAEYQKLRDILAQIGGRQDEFGKSSKKSFFAAISGAKSFEKSLKSAIKRIARMSMGLLGARSAFMALRRAANVYMEANEDLKNQMQGMWNILAVTIGPAVEQLVSWLTIAISYVNAFVQAMWGIDLVAKANALALKQQEKATTAAAKASKQLAGFDEMNKLTDNSTSSGSDTATAGTFTPIDVSADSLQTFIDTLRLVLPLVTAIAVGIKAWQIADFFGATLADCAGWALIIAGAVMTIWGFVDSIVNGLDWQNLLTMIVGIGVAVGGLAIVFGTTGVAIGLIVGGVMLVIAGFKDWLENGKSLEALAAITAGILAVGGALAILVGWPALIVAAVAALVVAIVMYWDEICAFLKKAWQWICNLFSGIGSWFYKNVIEPIVGFFAKLGKAVGDAIGNAFKAVVNAILQFAEDKINGFIKQINGAISLINKIPGVNIKTLSLLNIPKLARGGIVNNPGRGVPAIIGEAGAEAVLPLEHNTEWMDMLAEKISGNVTIPIYMDGKKIATYVVDIQKKKAFAMNGA